MKILSNFILTDFIASSLFSGKNVIFKKEGPNETDPSDPSDDTENQVNFEKMAKEISTLVENQLLIKNETEKMQNAHELEIKNLNVAHELEIKNLNVAHESKIKAIKSALEKEIQTGQKKIKNIEELIKISQEKIKTYRDALDKILQQKIELLNKSNEMLIFASKKDFSQIESGHDGGELSALKDNMDSIKENISIFEPITTEIEKNLKNENNELVELTEQLKEEVDNLNALEIKNKNLLD